MMQPDSGTRWPNAEPMRAFRPIEGILPPTTPSSTRKGHCVESLFAKLKDWRLIATRYDRCGELLLSAICIAATVIFWWLSLTKR